MRARAIENGAWMIAAAQGGVHEDGRETFGHSIIVDPWGRVVADAGDAEPGIIYAEIDPAASAAARAKIPNLKNARDFGVPAGRASAAEGGILIRFSPRLCEEATNSKPGSAATTTTRRRRSAASCRARCAARTTVDKASDGASRFDRPASRERMALAVDAEQRAAMAKLKALTEKLRENADYVGDKFAEEARKIHFGEADPRGIYGEATGEEARALAEDGVEFMPMPVLPDDRN